MKNTEANMIGIIADALYTIDRHDTPIDVIDTFAPIALLGRGYGMDIYMMDGTEFRLTIEKAGE